MPHNSQYRAGFVALFALSMLLLWATPAEVAADARQARRELTRIRVEIERELRARPEMEEAKQQWIDRRGEYNDLRRSVVDALLKDSRYLSLRAEMWALQDELNALRDRSPNGQAPMAEVHRLSLDIMDLGAYLSVLERRTLESHHEAMEARKAYLDAGRRLSDLRNSIAEMVHQDPRFREAHSALMDALSHSQQVP